LRSDFETRILSQMAKAKKKADVKSRASKTLYSAPALEKGFDIIELLATAPDGLTSSEIAQRLGRSLSEIFRILVVMERRSWLHKSSETDRYSVGYHMLENALRATPVQALSTTAAPLMYELARATTPIVSNNERNRKLNNYWAQMLQGDLDDPRYLALLRTGVTGYQEVTAADVKAMAKRWLSKGPTLQIQVKGTSKP